MLRHNRIEALTWLMPLIVGLISCTPARMAVAPELKSGFEVYKITERPGLLSGDKMKFGPFVVTDVEHDWQKGSSTTIVKYKEEENSQRYRFKLNGSSTWHGECAKGSGSKSLGVVSFDMSEGVGCSFNVKGGGTPGVTSFRFAFGGSSLLEATGKLPADVGVIRVTSINKVEGSNFGLGQPTGFNLYSGGKIVASADNVSKDGPVWLRSDLSPGDRDRVSLVITALLLMQQRL